MQKRSFAKILIANRGEIALRIMRTCRAMGIATVAVYSEADARAPHVRYADEAVLIGPAPSRESYLDASRIIEAAQRTGAEAIHPGYGFLSENAAFAEACAAAGLVFIGPAPDAIRRMGLKSAARQLAVEAGVPVVPGYDGADQRDETLRARMIEIGFPVLIKASAGGGGKGMRVVRAEEEIAVAIASARREAEKSFADGALLLEKFVEQARHVEIQILGDASGNLVHLFERDCSLQRRHQKVIEESPAPAVDETLRAKMGEAAVRIGRTIGYANAGTVEFILSPAGEFYFIEINTRLQVEHPVTEMITGLDLVRLQIEVAEGRPLPFAQEALCAHGHAIEARLYAEDPENDFLPSTGRILDLRFPAAGDGLRIDAGVEAGAEVGIYYDPMLAKLIAFGADRDAALRKLVSALRRTSLQGLRTNREFLIRLLEHPAFRAGEAHTGTIAEGLPQMLADEAALRAGTIAPASMAAAALYLQQQWRQADALLAELPPSYRNNPYRAPSAAFLVGEQRCDVSWQWREGGAYAVQVGAAAFAADVVSCAPGEIQLVIDGVQRTFFVLEEGARIHVSSSLGACALVRPPRHPIHQAVGEQGSANSPMPGAVLKILVAAGQDVKAGEPLLILEAMKMEHTMRAAVDGRVEAVLVKQGEIVAPGQLLVQITASSF
ncbi:MAG: acetyl-CoA carboxylase biotin carboxylase subunit [Blastocatellia bacterium]|nr:acetyl-CoA carboxylase biotin carboxylase subunit [Blastocatellia bacterium]